MRLVSWNVDGLARLLAPDALRAVHDELGAPDVLCLQEVRLRPRDEFHVALPGFACGYSLCDDPQNGRFRGGRTYGVMTLVRASMEPQWMKAAWDHEGRVLGCRLEGLTIMNAYAPNGTAKPYFDHERGVHHGTRSDFKRQFQRMLMDYVPRSELIMLGDWNVSREKIDAHPRLRTEAPHAAARAMWNELISSAGLHDVFRELYPELRHYTWFSRQAARYNRLDAARVDYALISDDMRSRVVDTGIAQEQAFRLGSDHAPLWLELRDI